MVACVGMSSNLGSLVGFSVKVPQVGGLECTYTTQMIHYTHTQQHTGIIPCPQKKDKTHTVLKSLVKKLKSYLEDWWATRNICIFSFPDDHAL
jgi:hypothetical protein